MSTSRLVGLHLAPGAVATVVFVLIAPPLESAGYPPVLPFFIAVVAIIIPWELGVVLHASRRARGGRLAAVEFREPLPRRAWWTLFPAVSAASLVGFLVLSSMEPFILDNLFAWLPSWFVELVPLDGVGEYSTGAWTISLILYGVMNVLVGPAVEEVYFRGYLLPRMERFGSWAPLVNSALFSLYHFWSPWAVISRIVGVLPFAYVVWRKRNIYLGMAVHMLLNGISTTLTIVAVVSQLN